MSSSLSLRIAAASMIAASAASSAAAQPLTERETRLRSWLARHHDEAIALLERVVNIPSGTLNLDGVRAVGDAFRAQLDSLGFTTRWIDLPPGMGRAGHLLAERAGPRADPQGKRLLLLGHLDTVFEGKGGQRFARADTIATGAGTADMKGGDVVIVHALRALHAVGALDEMRVIVMLTGDEELTARPVSVSRKPLREAAGRSDVALGFEGGGAGSATIARRGVSSWRLSVTARQAHSSGMFRQGVGYGAVLEAARILNEFRERLANRPYLTFNPGVIVGGSDVTYDTTATSGTAAGKPNIIASRVTVDGDLRFLTDGQRDSARAVMREIAARSLPGTRARLSFTDGYPGMPPSDGNRALLAVFDAASRALGWPAIQPVPADRRGAADIAFVADLVPSLDGLGPVGFGAHAPSEGVSLPSLRMAAERAALLMARLARIEGAAAIAVALP